MPLPNTRPIPAGWARHHQPVVAARMLSTVRLLHPGGLGVQDPATGRTPVLAPVPYYHGPGRVQARGPVQVGDSADRRPAVGAFLVAVPLDAGTTLLSDLVQVLDCPDPLLAGAWLVVVDVPSADIILERDLGCDRQTSTHRQG